MGKNMKKYICVLRYIHLNHIAVNQKLTQHCKSTISSVQLLSCVQLFETPRTAARQASLSITSS